MDDLHLGIELDKAIEERQKIRKLRAPEMEKNWAVNHASPMEGEGAAFSPWAADERNKALGQKPSAKEGELHGNFVSAAEKRKLAARKKFKVPKPVTQGAPPKAILDAH